MKILKTGTLCVLSTLCYAFTYAQQPMPVNETDYNKPKIFADLPQKIELNTNVLEALLNYEAGATVNLLAAPTFSLQGAVISKSDAADGSAKTVVVKSSNRQGATFTITRIRNNDGNFSYIGRMLSFKHGDAFEIAQENGYLVMIKKSLSELFNE